MTTNSTNNKYPRGSEWRKWDLHVHTKGTNKNDQFTSNTFDEFCKTLFEKALENNISAIGITDYFSVENYKKVLDYVSRIEVNDNFDNEEKEKIQNIFILPNVELRMIPSTDSGRLVNIHCIFHPEYVDNLENDFFSSIEHSAGSGKKFKMNKKGFVELGKDIDNSLDDEAARKKGVDNFVVSHETLQKLLDENSTFRKNTIIVVSNSSNDGASALQKHYDLFEGDSSSLDGLRKAIYCLSDVIFSGNPKDRKYFLGLKSDNKNQVIEKCGSIKPCIHGSDPCNEEGLFEPDEGRFCWIKADLTFEGLRQILYEPRYRVQIGENKPRKPTHFIESFTLDVPDDAKIEVSEEKQDEFILAGNNEEYELNPYFNCFIGGRGVGKSTLLSLLGLHSSDKESAKKFWNRDIKPYNESFDPGSILEVNGSNDFEYIGQGAVNKIASDTKKLTNYICSRIRQREGVNFENKEAQLNGLLQNIEQDIDKFEQRINIEKTIKELKEKKSTLEKVVGLEEDKELQEKKEKLEKKIEEISKLTSGKSDFFNLKSQLSDIVNQHTDEDDSDDAEEVNEKSYYEQQIEAIISSLKDVLGEIDEDKVEEKGKEEEALSQNIKMLEEEYEALLKEKGISQEDIKERSEAPSKIAEINRQLKIEKRKCDQIIEEILDDYKAELQDAAEEYEGVIKSSIESIKEKLSSEKAEESSLAELAISYSQDEERAWNELSIAFYQHYKHLRDGRSLEDNVRRLLVDDLKEFLAEDIELEKIRKKLENNETESGLFLKECFNQPYATEIFQRIRDKHLDDKNRYKKLSITYDEDPIEKRSFGERSTTVLIVFLLFGNKPIIIDEPEAHLDSRLIADYLVDLIKRVKIDRQIIFATHNANFVVNGDAEQIYILEVDKGRTKFTQTSIENLEHRKELLNLEGGKAAFDKRRQKYNF